MSSYNSSALDGYQQINGCELIPLHPWNKLIKGVERGKTPIDLEWTTKHYNQSDRDRWIDAGYNLGHRIKSNEIIIDLDPRNYSDNQDPEQLIAEAFGFFDFDELLWELPVVRTGAGGYHIYCTLPQNVDPKGLRTVCDQLIGVDFKRIGGYVVAAGSRHPNGNYYEWENCAERVEIPAALLEMLQRSGGDKLQKKDADQSSGFGVLNPDQLWDLALSKLDVKQFDSNSAWFDLLCECHHATGGTGVEVFVKWSLTDDNYSDQEHAIRSRWDSLSDSDNSRGIGSLIHRLKTLGESTSEIKAILDFSDKTISSDEDPESGDDIINSNAISRAVNSVDIDSLMETPKGCGAGEAGAAIAAVNELIAARDNASSEDKMKVIRLIKAAPVAEAIDAQEMLINSKTMTQGAINKRLKALDDSMIDSITEVLANTVLDHIFKDGAHIVTEPSGQIYIFNKTHWRLITDDYLSKIVYSVLDTLKSKITIKANEVSLVSAATKAIRIRSSVAVSKLFDVERILPIINCANGEIWINEDGTHTLRAHNPRSGQIKCLNVDYDPSVTGDLWLQTLREIFANFDDCDDIIRHLAEIIGYTLQPYKPDAAWWMFRGNGGDGKSTIIKVINAILGDALYSADESLLSAGNNGGNNHQTCDLVGKLAVVIQELKAGKALNDAGLKMLAENTKLTANPKNKDTFSFNYVGSLIMCCNHYPIIRDSSEGTLRRANVIPFNREFVKNGGADHNRSRQIISNKNELAGVLNWALEGYSRYVKRGKFLIPDSCVDAKNKWLCEGNNSIRYIKEHIAPSDPDDILGNGAEIYADYLAWCDSDGVSPKGKNGFYTELRNAGYSDHRSGKDQIRIFRGGKFL